MVARLVLDVIWRNRWFYVFAGGILVPFWHLFGLDRPNKLPVSLTGLSMVGAVVLGPLVAVTTMGLRELRHLPVTSRDVWRTAWVAATLVPAGVLLVSKLTYLVLVAAFGGQATMWAEVVALSIVFDFAWTGAAVLQFPALAAVNQAAARRGSTLEWLAAFGSVVVMLAAIGLAIPVGNMLPTGIAGFTPAIAAAVIIGVVASFGALAWTPRRGVLAGERPLARRPFPRNSTPARRIDRMTGLSRVAVPYLVSIVVVPLGVAVVLAVFGVTFGSGPWWFMPEVPSAFDPSDIGERGLTYFVILAAAINMQSLWTPWVRLLKVVPLPVRAINAVLLVTPFAAWLLLWLVGWSAYALAYGTPHTPRLEFAVGMGALATLAHAVLLRFHSSAGAIWAIGFVAGLTPQLARLGLRDGTAPQIAFGILGVAAVLAAAGLNHSTLTQSTSSSRAYQRPHPPFGTRGPQSVG